MSRSFVNAVYYPSWKVYQEKPPSSLPIDSITHVFYAFVGVNKDGTLRFFDDWADLNKDVDGETGCLGAVAKLKRRNPHIEILVSLGGGTGSAEFPELAASESARQTLARETREFCDRHGFDGLDLDWEHPRNPEQGRDYLKLLTAVRAALPSPRYLLTSALPVGEYCLKNIDVRAASSMLDFINLMGYDFTGGWTDISGHHAQLLPPAGDINQVHPTLRASTSSGVDYLMSQGFPSRKILLGVPAYGRYFAGARGPGQPFTDSGELDYADMPDEWVQNAKVDLTVAAASCVDPTGEKGFVSFDVPGTVRMKARYSQAMALGGLFYWTGAGDRQGAESLVISGYDELASASVN